MFVLLCVFVCLSFVFVLLCSFLLCLLRCACFVLLFSVIVYVGVGVFLLFIHLVSA